MPSLERRRLQCYLAIMVVDIAVLFGAFLASGYLYQGDLGATRALLFAQLLLPIFLTIAFYNGAYSIVTIQHASRGAFRTTIALAIAFVVVQTLIFYDRSSAQYSRIVLTLGITLSVLALCWARLQMRAFVRWRCGHSVINELVIDDAGPHVGGSGAIRICAHDFGLEPDLGNPHALDRIGIVLRNADRVLISCPPERRAKWAMVLKSANVAGEVIDDRVAELGALGARTGHGHGWLEVSSGPLGLRERAMKRLLDVTVAGLVLLVLSPLLLLVSLAIVAEDAGPVFFIQRRLGRGNRFFAMYKFRSMRVERSDADGARSASRTDDRVTRVGRLIRATSIDELPQLFNVLIGDMSLVGPRPHAIGSQAGDKLFWEVDQRYWLRHALKPGITGLAQIRGWRGATDTELDLQGRLDADLEYLHGWSLWRDVAILVATLRVVMHERAY